MAAGTEHVRFEPDEKPSIPLTIASGGQAAIIIIAPIVLTVVIIMRVAEQPDAYISWAVFSALLISGLTTALQAVRFKQIGSGHILIMGTSGTYLAVCVAALANGGPALMATLIAASAFIQFVVGARLSLLRRVFTPVVIWHGHHADCGNHHAACVRHT